MKGMWNIVKYSRFYTDQENEWISSESAAVVTVNITSGQSPRLVVSSAGAGVLEDHSLQSGNITASKIACLTKDMIFGCRYYYNTFERKFQLQFKTFRDSHHFKESLSQFIKTGDVATKDTKKSIKFLPSTFKKEKKHLTFEPHAPEQQTSQKTFTSTFTQTDPTLSTEPLESLSDAEIKERIKSLIKSPTYHETALRLAEIIDQIQ